MSKFNDFGNNDSMIYEGHVREIRDQVLRTPKYRTPDGKKKNRTLYTCLQCGKPGYLYVHKRGNHKYMFTIHSIESPIGRFSNGRPKFRSCYKKGRLYNSLQEMFAAEQGKRYQ